MKPIEPGCMAMVINVPEHAGKTVTVIDWWPKGEIRCMSHGALWRATSDGWLVQVEGGQQGHFCPVNLMRIDGYELDLLDRWRRANPKITKMWAAEAPDCRFVQIPLKKDGL